MNDSALFHETRAYVRAELALVTRKLEYLQTIAAVLDTIHEGNIQFLRSALPADFPLLTEKGTDEVETP